MTKAEEINLLRMFIDSLPTDSYLRPWLEQVEPQVISEIRSDFCVSPSITEARKQCDQIENEAREKAKTIIDNAHAQAKKIEVRADSYITSILSSIRAAERALC